MEARRRHNSTSQKNCKSTIHRLYFSKYLQFFYLILIGFCIFDIVWTIVTWRDYPNNNLALILDLVLNLIIVLDSFLRLYAIGTSVFCDCRNFIEILVLVLAIPEVIFVVTLISIDFELSEDLVLVSLVYSGVVIVLRPVVFCKRQTGTNIESIHLPQTVVYEEGEAKLIREESRFDSDLADSSGFDTRKSLTT